MGFGPILEPNEQKLMDQLVPIYLKTIIQSVILIVVIFALSTLLL